MNGLDTNYAELNAAIWKQAVKDEIKHQKSRMFRDLKGLGISVGITNGIKAHEPYLMKAVRNKICREAMMWLMNGYPQKDKEFEIEYVKIKADIFNTIKIKGDAFNEKDGRDYEI